MNRTTYFLLYIILSAFILAACSVAPESATDIYSTRPRSSAIVSAAESYLSVPYKYGGSGIHGMDCSGLVVAVYKKAFGVALPHSTAQLYKLGYDVPRAGLRTGDLVFFTTRAAVLSHVGIYTGNGVFIHASSSKGVIRSNLASSYYKKRFYGARRIANSLR